MADGKRGITIAGSLIADVFYDVDSFPKEGFLTNVRNTSFNVGGSGNLILDLAKLDSELCVKVCAVIGDDERGRDTLGVLSKYPGIDTSCISLEGQSATCMVMNAEDTKQRTFFYIPASSDAFNISHIDFEALDTKIFHLEYLLLMKQVDSPDAEYGTHGARILKTAKEHGMMTSIDMVSEQSDRAKAVVTSALKYTDICCINELEAEMITGVPVDNDSFYDGAQSAAQKIKSLGVSKWVVIHSAAESFGLDCESGESFIVPSLSLPSGYIKGANGAGDAYCSGILYGAHENMGIKEAMLLARACAACSLSESNGTDGMRPYKDVLKLAEKFG